MIGKVLAFLQIVLASVAVWQRQGLLTDFLVTATAAAPVSIEFGPLVRAVWSRRPAGRAATALAVRIIGESRPGLAADWAAVLAEVRSQPDGRPLRIALGFIRAALRLRAQDLADLLWRPVDAILASRPMSGLVVAIPALIAVRVIVDHDGGAGLILDAEALAAFVGFFALAIRFLREWRDIQPPKHEPRRRSSDS